jgi:TPR repeat protein
LDRDYAKARDWYEKSSAAGDTGAMCALAEIYAPGPIKSYEVARRPNTTPRKKVEQVSAEHPRQI